MRARIGHVAREAIKLGHESRTSILARCGERFGKVRTPIERIDALGEVPASTPPL
jgi:hypothetical protein